METLQQKKKKVMLGNIINLVNKLQKVEKKFLLSTLSIETLLSKKYLESLITDLINTNKLKLDENEILSIPKNDR